MYRESVRLMRNLLSDSFSLIYKPVFLGVNYENHISKRWAGHSKWQNIKSTKQAMDQAKSNIFGKLSRQIILAVKEGGDDMKTNQKLRDLWEEAKKSNMPRAKFDNSVKGAKLEGIEKPYWTVFSGPKGVVLGLEVSFANKKPGFIKTLLGSQIKKLNLKMEPHYQELCIEKGVIMTDPLPNIDNPYERALEDAIEAGVDEVFENEDKTLIFECLHDRVDSIAQKLESKGYSILSASVELDFKEFIELQQEEIENLETIINKLKNSHAEIIRASYNVATP